MIEGRLKYSRNVDRDAQVHAVPQNKEPVQHHTPLFVVWLHLVFAAELFHGVFIINMLIRDIRIPPCAES